MLKAPSILSVQSCYRADELAIESGVRSLTLMENAGAGIAKIIQKRFSPCKTIIL